jgi:hypothetical protein
MTLFRNLILFTNHYGNLQEMLEMAFLKYVDLYLRSDGLVSRETLCIIYRLLFFITHVDNTAKMRAGCTKHTDPLDVARDSQPDSPTC